MWWQAGMTGRVGKGGVAVLLAVVVPLALGGRAEAERPAKPAPKPAKRSPPPTGAWDKGTAGTFFDDAFSTLDGPRPAFASKSAAPAAAQAAATAAGAGAEGGFRWSTLVSEGTLTDEIKDMKAVVAEAIARPADFKGGGYEKAREAFSSIALAFAVIAAYDQDIRWKKDAERARDLFARVGFNCKVGTDQSLAESKLGLADLESMLDGGSPQRQSDRDEDFLWSQAAGRPALMKRLEAAETGVAAGMASRADFDRRIDELVHDAEMVAAIGEAVQQPDYEYHDDETYRGHSAAMRDAAVRLRAACAEKNYESARSAAGELKKSCDACHGDYRS
ncbi:MAG: hypothetical protein ACKO40_09270 [Planctomycetaceae bacterium]